MQTILSKRGSKSSSPASLKISDLHSTYLFIYCTWESGTLYKNHFFLNCLSAQLGPYILPCFLNKNVGGWIYKSVAWQVVINWILKWISWLRYTITEAWLKSSQPNWDTNIHAHTHTIIWYLDKFIKWASSRTYLHPPSIKWIFSIC